jgi:DMSO/TMAO reductase YedYZ molybdopterin-dependent catalytic subunit
MPIDRRISRRRLLAGLSSGAAAIALSGCDQLSNSPWFRNVIETDDDISRTVQRFLLSPRSMAREFSEADLSKVFRANGTTNPTDPAYQAMVANGFADWRLKVGGLVEAPAEFSLAELRAMPARTQITRHDCVEGWSCIGKWTGVQLAAVLDKVKLKPEARYVVFTCADELERRADGTGRYYESVDLEDAYHPQTILAYDMNGETLTVPHGAPLRVRVERQLGYKMAKYLMRIDAVSELKSLGRGQGGYWPDRGYDWYAGI